MLLEYGKIIKDQLKAGIIEIVNPEVSNRGVEASSNLPVHYLPHHGVVCRDSQMEKLRIAYNESARALGDEYSLNDCLQTGSNCIPMLFDILI